MIGFTTFVNIEEHVWIRLKSVFLGLKLSNHEEVGCLLVSVVS
jgi:hypothetical protein